MGFYAAAVTHCGWLQQSQSQTNNYHDEELPVSQNLVQINHILQNPCYTVRHSNEHRRSWKKLFAIGSTPRLSKKPCCGKQ